MKGNKIHHDNMSTGSSKCQCWGASCWGHQAAHRTKKALYLVILWHFTTQGKTEKTPDGGETIFIKKTWIIQLFPGRFLCRVSKDQNSDVFGKMATWEWGQKLLSHNPQKHRKASIWQNRNTKQTTGIQMQNPNNEKALPRWTGEWSQTARQENNKEVHKFVVFLLTLWHTNDFISGWFTPLIQVFRLENQDA